MLPSLLPDDPPRYNRHQARHQDFVKGGGANTKIVFKITRNFSKMLYSVLYVST